MTLKKVNIVEYIALINLQFPNSYRFSAEHDQELIVSLWFEGLRAYPKEICDIAVRNALFNAEFAPKISTILSEIKKLTEANEKSDLELWAELDGVLYEVYDAAKYLRYPQHYSWAKEKIQGIYDRLSPEIKLFVVNLSSLIELANMSERTDDDGFKFEKARFLKLMPNLCAQAKNRQAAENLLKLTNSEDLKLLLGGRND